MFRYLLFAVACVWFSASNTFGAVGSKWTVGGAGFDYADHWHVVRPDASYRIKLGKACEKLSGHFTVHVIKKFNNKVTGTNVLGFDIVNGALAGNSSWVAVGGDVVGFTQTHVGGVEYQDVDVSEFSADGNLYGSRGTNIVGGAGGEGTATITRVDEFAPHPCSPDFVIDITVTPEVCSDECATCLNSIHSKFGLEKTAFGDFSGFLKLDSELPTVNLASPDALKLHVNEDFAVINQSNHLRQILGPRVLADVVISNKYQYDIFMYPRDAVGPMTNGVYSVLNNSPFRQVTVQNPDGAASQNRFFIKIIEGGTENLITYTLTNLSATSTLWTYTTHNGAYKETLQVDYTNNSLRKIETRTIYDPANDAVVYKERNVYDDIGVSVLSQKIVDPDGANLVTSYSYYTNRSTTPPDSQRYSQLKEVIYPDGKWEKFDYGDSGRVTTNIIGFLNNADTTADDANRAIYHIYSNASPHEVIIESLLGQEMSRKYRVYTSTNVISEIQCQTPGASITAPDNMTNITTYFPGGAAFESKPQSILNYDGTISFCSYSTNDTTMTTVVTGGVPNSGRTAVVEGQKTVTVVGLSGQMISNLVSVIVNGADGPILAQQTYTYDAADTFCQSPVVTYLDGTTEIYNHGCCVLESFTDRGGATTSYEYDALKRRVAEITQFGIKTTNVFDAQGHVLETVRIGSDSSWISQYKAAYDLAGQVLKETNALGGVTVHSNNYSNGYLVATIAYPDTGTEIKTYNKDGTIESITGTAVHPIRYEYGILNDSGTSREYIAEIRLDRSFANTSEGKTNVLDMLKRHYKTIASNGGVNQSFYNDLGRIIKTVDADSVTNLIGYTATGEVATNAIDMDGNGLIDLGALDRVTFVTNDIIANHGAIVRRTRTSVWKTLNNSSDVIIATNETSINGMTNWDSNFGLTTITVKSFPQNGWTTLTKTCADGSSAIVSNYFGRLISTTLFYSDGNRANCSFLEYDAHGRVSSTTDLENHRTNYTFTAGDEIATITTPAPMSGQTVQVTSNLFDKCGHITTVVLPDNTLITNSFTLSGELRQSSGSRTFPVQYSFDAQGRVTNMITWTNFVSGTGARAVSWIYSETGGNLQRKVFADGTSIGYTYTLGGRLRSRSWARGTNCQYSYTCAGELLSMVCNDGSPGITNTYDRLGRVVVIQNGDSVINRAYDDVGHILTETYAGGLLSGLGITNRYDTLFRRTNLTTRFGSVVYEYDKASRLSSVNAGANSVDYNYLDGSHIVKMMNFKREGQSLMTTERSFDLLNRLTNIVSKKSAGATLFSYAYSYNNANQRTRVDIAELNEGGKREILYGYDSLGQLTSGSRFWSSNSPVPGQQFEYTFDDTGNRIETRTGGDQNGENLRVASYIAGDLNQYTRRDVPGAVDIMGLADDRAVVTVNDQSPYRKGEYFWKELEFGNGAAAIFQSITNKSVLLAVTNTVTGSRRLSKTPEGFTYDPDGNLTSDGLWTNSWDAYNRLVQIVTASGVSDAAKLKLDFIYDAQGRRVQKIVSHYIGGDYMPISTNRFLYDGWNLIAELNGANELVRGYTWGVDLGGQAQENWGVGGLLSVTTNGGVANFVVYDGNGNVMALVNSANINVTAQYDYGPFGELIRSTGPMAKGNPFRFSTKYTDDETDLIYYGYRFYNPSTGRWLSRDPLEEVGGLNLYSFVKNDCINFMEFNGLLGNFGISAFGQGIYGTFKSALGVGGEAVDYVKGWWNTAKDKGTGSFQFRREIWKSGMASMIVGGGGSVSVDCDCVTVNGGVFVQGQIKIPFPAIYGLYFVGAVTGGADGIDLKFCRGKKIKFGGRLLIGANGGIRAAAEIPYESTVFKVEAFVEGGVFGQYSYIWENGPGKTDLGVYLRAVVDFKFGKFSRRAEYKYTIGTSQPGWL